MFKKLLAFLKPSVGSVEQKKTKPRTTSPRKKIESTRIGELGEYKISIQLDQLPKECRYLDDLLIKNPKSRSGYSQIDHVVISPYALFVIETKNYNGEIKGNRDDKYWLVSKRFRLYNPILQNFGHIKALERLMIEFNTVVYVSMISFTMRCRFSIDPELRKIQSNDLVVYDVELSEFISRKLIRLKTESPDPLFTNDEIDHIYDILAKANISDPIMKAEHIEKIKSKPSVKESI